MTHPRLHRRPVQPQVRRPALGLRNSARHSAIALLCVTLILSCARCATPAPRRTTEPKGSPFSVNDPCAMRLHDLLGGLLLYYAQHDDLPPNLKSLPLPSGDIATAMHCPVSNQPYIYDPIGLPAPDGKSLLIIYDAVPAHSWSHGGPQGGFRWAVAITEPRPGQPLIAEVIAVPESTFALSRPR